MSQLLETIKCKDGKLYNLPFHNSRLNKARNECFGLSGITIDLQNSIVIPERYKTGLFRCRVVYSSRIEKIEFLPHQYRKIKTIKIVKDNSIDYHLKYENRIILQQLYNKRGNCDDIIIVKNECVTDSFTANLIFFDGEKWWTPDTPLLSGTQRARLLEEQNILECRITINDFSKYKKIGFINALQDLDEMPVIKISDIHF